MCLSFWKVSSSPYHQNVKAGGCQTQHLSKCKVWTEGSQLCWWDFKHEPDLPLIWILCRSHWHLTLLQHILRHGCSIYCCSTCNVFKAVLVHPKKGEPFSLEFNPHYCNNHLAVLKRRLPYSRTGRERGEKWNREEKQKVQLAPAAELLVTKLITKGKTAGTGMQLSCPKGNSSLLSSGETLRSVSVWPWGLFWWGEKKKQSRRGTGSFPVFYYSIWWCFPLYFS